MTEQCKGEPDRAPIVGDRCTFHVPHKTGHGLDLVVSEAEARGWRLLRVRSKDMPHVEGRRIATVEMEYIGHD